MLISCLKTGITIFLIIIVGAQCKMLASCTDDIYCQGKILHTVQNAYLFPDSKTFVDMKMNYKPEEVKKRFNEMMKSHGHRPSKKVLHQFVKDCFSGPGNEFHKHNPKDWVRRPHFVNRLQDRRLQNWALDLHRLWATLSRKMKDDVRKHQEQYSILYVPNPIIIPGGKYREMYYWDSYWIFLGLLQSEMTKTVKGMLENFLRILKVYGLIPNGGRKYYVQRSQPPLLIPMVKEYYEFTSDKSFVQKHVDLLETEFQFWMDTRTVSVSAGKENVRLAHYNVETSGPRPESYREDMELASNITEKDQNQLFCELKSACESGWDFSSRWFINESTNTGNLLYVKTRSIIPVDLNAILCWDAKLLQYFYKITGNKAKESKYKKIAEEWQKAVETLLWSEKDGIWYDYDISSKKQREYFYLSNIAPLWTGCYNKGSDKVADKVVDYLERLEITRYKGGIPTSFETSGEQWDFPNAWPPLQHIAITGLNATGNKRAMDLADQLVKKWIRANFKGYLKTHVMFDKYNAEVAGGYGIGGHPVQFGFGWTNGVCIDLLSRFGPRIDTKGISIAVKHKPFSRFLIVLVVSFTIPGGL